MIGRAPVYFLLFAIQTAIFFALPRLYDTTLFTAAVAVMDSATAAASVPCFGPKYMGGIYGWILPAWGAAARSAAARASLEREVQRIRTDAIRENINTGRSGPAQCSRIRQPGPTEPRRSIGTPGAVGVTCSEPSANVCTVQPETVPVPSPVVEKSPGGCPARKASAPH